jgi:hypothetical protein
MAVANRAGGNGEGRIIARRSRLERAERCASMAGSISRAFGVLLAVFGYAATGLIAPVAAAESLGRITFAMPVSCVMDTGRKRIRSLSYYLNFQGNSVPVSFDSNGETITWAASLAPGIYFYQFYGWAAPVSEDPSQGFCSSDTQTIVVLPGDTLHVSVDMRNSMGVLDDIVRSPVVFGTAPRDVRVKLISFKAAPPCGSTVSAQSSSTIPVQRDSVGYWSQGSGPEMALELQRGSQARYVRVEYEYWAGHVHVHYVRPLRFDVTPALMRSALAGRADTLLCL